MQLGTWPTSSLTTMPRWAGSYALQPGQALGELVARAARVAPLEVQQPGGDLIRPW